MTTVARNRPDLVIVGGGLAGGLVALAFAKWRPEVRVELLEAGPTFGGNHIWSFFASDLSADAAALVEPLLAARWQGYDIAFPARRRTLSTPYASITSQRLDAVVRERLGDGARTNIAVHAVEMHGAVLAHGDRIDANAVLDARGAGREVAHYRGGWQKFVGQRWRTARPHGLTRPIVMDATVEQIDGYRFVYVLPFADDELFIEDTYYSDTPNLDRDVVVARIAAYAATKAWVLTDCLGEERGCLPVVSGGDFDAVWPADDRVARVGTGAGAFQPTTGYSLPFAAESAVALAKGWPFADLGSATRAMAKAQWQRGGFYRLLDKMLFGAAVPDQRYKILEHFYRLPEPVIERFYAGKSSLSDKMRVLSGRPPVPIGAAIRALKDNRK